MTTFDYAMCHNLRPFKMNVLALTFKCICVGTHAFNTCLHNNNNVGCIHVYFVKIIFENYIRIQMRPKLDLKKLKTMLCLLILV